MAAPSDKRQTEPPRARPAFPFTAVVGQDEMKLALLLNVIAPAIGGVLVTGHRGTAKSTAVRALADLLPQIKAVRGCAYNCDPFDADALCDDCLARLSAGEKLKAVRASVPVVELPLGATEDRVCGTIDLGRALKEGVKAFEPGLLARANRGFLYIDEVNLLEDHLVDLLLDVAATARNRVEREGVSAEHPSRFRLVGSCNPEEGELRPQLLDRFGLCAEVETVRDLDSRVLIVERREAFENDTEAFIAAHSDEQERLRRRVTRAARAYASVKVTREVLRSIAQLCLRLGVDGHRGEITITRAARALAAFEGRRDVTSADVRRVAPMSLRHRLRRDPLEQSGGARVENHLDELFGDSDANAETNSNHAATNKRRDDSIQPRSHAQPNRGDNNGRGDDGSELKVATVKLRLNEEPTAAKTKDSTRRTRKVSHTARMRTGTRGSTLTARGRYAGASIEPERGARSVAVDATLRAAATRLSRTNDAERALDANELRFKRFKGKAGTLFVFLVDASGSMALNRIGQAKGALAQLLRRSYVNRDRVSLISFRGRDAQVLLAPSTSVSRARKLLDEMSVGGGSPLAAGLARALEVARRAKDAGARQIRLVVFTDGRANVPLVDEGKPSSNVVSSNASRKARIAEEIARLGASLRAACAGSLVIDTQARFTSNGEGEFLSGALDARYLRLPRLITEESLAEEL
jgi:magnesium chelatase subunit D